MGEGPASGDAAAPEQRPAPEEQASTASREHALENKARGLLRWAKTGDVPVGIIAALVAIASAVFAYEQTATAKAQNDASEQASLVALVTDISQQLQIVAAKPGEQVNLQQEMLTEAAEGLHLTKELGNSNIPSVDDYELGEGFENSEEYRDALIVYQEAASKGDTHYTVFSLRAIAKIDYGLAAGSPTSAPATDIRGAHEALAAASEAYVGQPDVTGLTIARSDAYNDLFDINVDSKAECARWATEMNQAHRLFLGNRQILGDASEPGSIGDALPAARSRLQTYCNVSTPSWTAG